MSDKPTLQELLEVQNHYELPSPALVEKDWYVVKALAAITSVRTEPLRLVFGGGTALSRAHGLLKRMSEDIDLKIVADTPPSRAVLRGLRGNITNALLGAGFAFDPENPAHRTSMHEGRFTRYRLPYDPIAAGAGVLRPEIQIETSVFPMRRPSIDRTVTSFIAEGFGREAEVSSIACAAVIESAAEKFVALTRRGGAELAGLRKERDPTLVRHIYDLNMLHPQLDLAELAALTRDIMKDDAVTYGKDFPAYRDNPLAETLRAVDGIAADKLFSEGYANFRRDMVYGDAPSFDDGMKTLQAIAANLKAP